MPSKVSKLNWCKNKYDNFDNLCIVYFFSDLETCNLIKEKEHGESRYYIEIVMHYAGVSAALVNPDPVKKPRVRCRTSDLANTVSQQINYAKRMYIEHLYTLSNDNISISED